MNGTPFSGFKITKKQNVLSIIPDFQHHRISEMYSAVNDPIGVFTAESVSLCL